MISSVSIPLLVGLSLAVGLEPAEQADRLIELSGVRGGLIVHLGCGDGQLTAALGARERFLVHGLDADAGQVQAARAALRAAGRYGRVSIGDPVGNRLPYADQLVNLLIGTDLGEVPLAECLRVLAPNGVALINQDGQWRKLVKPWPDAIDEWTHHLRDASGNAVACDRVVGPPRHLQWTAGPRWARSHGWTPTVTAMVSSRGRLFAICDETLNGAGNAVPSKWFVVARDAFSGVLLWKQPIPEWGSQAFSGTPDSGSGVSTGRFTMPPHAAKRLVAVGDTVYVTLGPRAPVSALDAATGVVKQTYAKTANADEILYAAGQLLVSVNPRVERPPLVAKEETPPPAPGKSVRAVDASTGRLQWEAGPFAAIRAGRGQDPFGRLELCAGDDKVFLLTAEAIHCLAQSSGETRWQIPRPALPASAVRRLGFSGIYEYQLTVMLYQRGVVLLAQPEPNTHHTYHTMPGTLYAFDARDGQMLWRRPYGGWGHCTPPDIFVVGDRVWCHVHVPTDYGRVWGDGYRAQDSSVVDYRIQALDLRTGEVRAERATKEIFNVGHHHRCYRNKITERFLLSSRRGVEFVDLQSGENYQNHWVRSGCKVGYLPCNGMLFVAPHPCGCYINAKLTGFNALAPRRDAGAAAAPREASVHPTAREALQRGPAFGAVDAAAAVHAGDRDWPTYRHDACRSGATEATIGDRLQIAWSASVGSRPSALVAADDKVLAADVEAHRVVAWDAETGEEAWSRTVGGRVQTPPTLYGGLAIFGATDGCVYCVRAADGALVWRFQAAPERRLVTVRGQLESAWPVPGVLVQDGTCWFAAGRSSYLDGGLSLYALDAHSGNIKRHQVFSSRDPQTGKMAVETSAQQMKGLLNDIPGSDGRHVFIRQRCVSSDGPAAGKHLFTSAGYLDATWFNRTFWQIGNVRTTGPLVLGHGVAYGVEPFTSRSRDVVMQPGRSAYRLRCLNTRPRPVTRTDRRGKQVRRAETGQLVWERRLGIRTTALVRAGDRLVAAGSPDVVAADDPHGAWEGRLGGRLAIFQATDGKPVGEIDLPAPPVWDGLAVARGRVFAALQDGTVVCLQ